MVHNLISDDPSRNSSAPGNQEIVYALLDKLIQTVDAHTKITELVVSRIPSMIESAAGLVTAADGAKLPARTPPPMPPEPPPVEYDEEPEAPATPDDPWFRQVLGEGMKAFASTMAEKLGASISSIPLSALLDWTKAMPKDKPAAPAPQAPPAAPRRPHPARRDRARARMTAFPWPRTSCKSTSRSQRTSAPTYSSSSAA